ncbi:MAG: transcriptional regulator [Deltaproteobacteria bacterium]
MARDKRLAAGTDAPVPPERLETARRRILLLISERPLTAKAISADVRIPEKEVRGHLEHLRKTLRREGRRVAVTPAECLACGFVFRKRERFAAPGRCPVCRGESVSEPLFFVPMD